MASQFSRQSCYGPCDSFFVESDEMSMAERVRERARQVAKIRQQELAAELSAVTSDEYLEEILDHMEQMEELTMPDVASIDIQHEIEWYMRPYLIDFLTEAHAAFQLLPETLHLTINILDRYCSRRVVYKRHYQLVACAALLIASKYGDKKDRVPTFRELRSVCCNLFEEEMFQQMEWHVLQTLDYVLGHPTADSFLQIALAETSPGDKELQHLTWYVCEMALYHRDFVSVRPSVLARSALGLARFVLNRSQLSIDTWAGRYDTDVIYQLHKILEHPTSVLKAKFSSSKLSTAAQTIEMYIISHNQEQAMAAAAAAAAAAVVVEEQKLCDSGYGTPSTPQKHSYTSAVMAHGCLTPPITPNVDNAGCMVYPPHQTAYPSTPSPVPSHHMSQDMTSHHYAQAEMYYNIQ